MATANQLKMLVKSHFEENNEKFNTIALQIAAHEARLGHTNLANDIRKIIESSKNNKPRLKNIDSNLQGLFLEIYPQERLSDLVVSPQIKERIERIIHEFTYKDKLFKHNLENRRKILLSGNPGTGVSNASIEHAIKLAKEYFGGMIIAGKMHSSGIDEPLVDLKSIEGFIEAGADIILMPAVNTVPGLSEAEVTEACKLIKSKGALSLSAIGTSQESSDEATIREIALINKRCGIDIQHIGDAGWCGIALPENIMALSIAIRGKRWTYHTIASSVNR